jgi:hypothetical protein
MSELQQILQHLRQPEYVHVLLNPLPVYMTAAGVLALALALCLRSRPAQVVGLVVVLLGCAAVWPVIEYGEAGYDRVLAMSNADAQAWLKAHMHRAERFAPLFYVTAVLAAAAIGLPWKFPKTATPLALATLVFAAGALGVGGWISHAGGQVRHSEFRGEPPVPVKEHDEHHH